MTEKTETYNRVSFIGRWDATLLTLWAAWEAEVDHLPPPSPSLQVSPLCGMIHGWCRLTEQRDSSDHRQLNSSEQPETLAPGCAVSRYLSAKCQPQLCSLSDEKLKERHGERREGGGRDKGRPRHFLPKKHLCQQQKYVVQRLPQEPAWDLAKDCRCSLLCCIQKLSFD